MRLKFIEIKWGSQLLYFTAQELHGLLSRDMALWEEATRRGKAFKRARQSRARQAARDRKYCR
jgi:hypothetical protein